MPGFSHFFPKANPVECSSSCWFNLSEHNSAHYLSLRVGKRGTHSKPRCRTWTKFKPWQEDLSPICRLTPLFSLQKCQSAASLLFGLVTKSFTHWWESQIPLKLSWSGEEQPVPAGATALCQSRVGLPPHKAKTNPMCCFLKEIFGVFNKNLILLRCKVHSSLPV